MSTRIVIPVLDESGLNATISDHFGRSPYFLSIDINENGIVLAQETTINSSEHFGGVGHPGDRIIQLKPKAVITYGMGPRALNLFQNEQVAVLKANASKVAEVLSAYNNNELEELTEGCHQARHQ
jgi:predicted Fe-Mo cluster-binding NifX family protein